MDQVVVVIDDRTRDKTADVVKSLGGEVYPFLWVGSFSAIRNFAVKKCRHPWCLMLDTDELIPPMYVGRIVELLENEFYKEQIAFAFARWNRSGRNYPDWQARFFRTDSGIYWVRPTHEVIDPSVALQGQEVIHIEDIVIFHWGEIQSYMRKIGIEEIKDQLEKKIPVPERRLNLGCGKEPGDPDEGWVNVDIAQLPGVDVVWDCNEKLPFEDNFFDEIRTTHTLEHLRDKVAIIEELWRVAKDEAGIYICVPNGANLELAISDPQHRTFWGPTNFDYFIWNEADNHAFHFYSHARFEIEKQEHDDRDLRWWLKARK